MKTYDYTPQALKMEDGSTVESPFTGKVVLEVPYYKERLELARIVQGDGKESSVDVSMKALEVLEKHVQKVDVVSEKHDIVIDTFQDLGLYEEGGAMINDMIQILIKGIPLGEASGLS